MIKDSGERTEFSTGAKRDIQRGKGRMDLLPWYGIMEVSKHCEEGAEKYGEHNVDKGIPLHSLCDSAARHLAKFIAGEVDEDHLRAAAWNLLWALNQRTTHPELDDIYSHKETSKENGEIIKDIKEPTAIEPLSKELLLGMNGRFVYVVLDEWDVHYDVGWCRIAVQNDDISIIKENDDHDILWERHWNESETKCYLRENPQH